MTVERPQPSEAGRVPVSTIPVEEAARYPQPGMAIPGEFAFSPDDTLITYLFSPEGNLVRQLYSFDPETGEQRLLVAPVGGGSTDETVSLEEALRRERQRQREQGVTQYTWAEQGDRILVPMGGGITVHDGPGTAVRQVVAGDDPRFPILDPQLSPDGEWIGYVQDAEIYIISIEIEGGEPRQITHGARGTGKTHGLAEYVAQEEMDRSHGFWWAPDSERIAFTEVDETHIPVYRIVHQGKDIVGEGAQEEHRYPFAGGPNAKVRLGVVGVAGGEPVWMDLGDEHEAYLARVAWLPDGGLCAQVENREQTALDLVRLDPATGQRELLLREVNDVWINLHDMFRSLKGEGGGFIWASERTGFCHLYLYDARGHLVRPLTEGEWAVDALAGVDEQSGLVYFTATRDGAVERRLYVVGLAGGEPRCITPEPGTHAVVLDHVCRQFVDVHESLDKAPTVTLRSLVDGAVLHVIYDERDPRIEQLALEPPELVTLQNRDGVTLYGLLYRPPAGFGDGPYRTIVNGYGGPHVQLVTDGWGPTADMRRQVLRCLGFLVFVLDNRGSARRGLEFEGTIKDRLGQIEVQDQVDGVRWLIDQGLADPDHVGVYGWSYGGYIAAMCLAQAGDVFKVAVAGAPVTHYDGYDTHYTERYMSMPQSNPEGYEAGSVMHYVDDIVGKLLLIHGLIDENVHFRHTARLINALIRARKPYDLLIFPDARHGRRYLADRVYMEERIRDYFIQHL